ncbi:MAG: glucose 1-dehydrogenase [Desulfatiglandales bacterium]
MKSYPNPFSLEGKVSFVTGGSRGLGLGMARALTAAGSDLVIMSRTQSELEEAKRVITEETGREVAIFTGDISSLEDIDRVFSEAIKVFPGIDILLNNAGVNCRKPFLEISPEEFDGVVDVNFRGMYFITQRIARHMVDRGQGGKIINISSITSIQGLANISVYGGTKGAVYAITKSLAIELAPHNIQANAIAPGYFRTSFTEAAFQVPERAEWIHSRIPMGRTGNPEDLGGLAVFLASPASDYLTGTVVFADGGWTSG